MTSDSGLAVFRRENLEPGLYLVATPIGNVRDMTLRALDILASADVIAAEDTRMTRRLMDLHGVPVRGRPMIPYHDHNGAAQRPRLLARIDQGQAVAFVSDAGTPLVADPGYQLARAATEAGCHVTAAPGASAVLTALTLAGLPSDRFMFAGFPPTATGARRQWMEEILRVQATVILFEAPTRIYRTLAELCEVGGEGRRAALCRELTKKFEQVRRGTLAEIRDGVQETPPKGEIVLLVDRADIVPASAFSLQAALREALQTMPVRDASTQVAQDLGLRRRDVYQMALALRAEDREDDINDH